MASAGLSKRVKALEREARALTRLIRPSTIEAGFCVSEAGTKSRLYLLTWLELALSLCVFKLRLREFATLFEAATRTLTASNRRAPLQTGHHWFKRV
jgi:hypothetical protein